MKPPVGSGKSASRGAERPRKPGRKFAVSSAESEEPRATMSNEKEAPPGKASLYASLIDRLSDNTNFAEDSWAAAAKGTAAQPTPPPLDAVSKPPVKSVSAPAISRRRDVQPVESAAAASLRKIFGPSDPQRDSAQEQQAAGGDTQAGGSSSLASRLHPKLRRAVTEKLKVTRLTRVQELAWEPMMLEDRDVLIRSETGSGKTLAYLGPLLHALLTDCDTKPIDRSCGTLIIVLAPTRELVEQVSHVAQILLQNAQFVTVGSIHGGDNRHKEKARLRKGIHVLVATPGRLLDHLKTTAAFDKNALRCIVLDEADRLLDCGFEKALREIMAVITPSKRVLVSATITSAVERLSHFALHDPIRVGETEDTFQVPASLRQHYSIVPAKHRLSTLASFLRSQLDAGSKKIVVFMSTSDSTEFHYTLLSRLENPFHSRKRRFEGQRTDARRAAPRKGVKKLMQTANQHLDNDDDEALPQDVVDFDDGDNGDDDNAPPPPLLRTDSFLNVNIFKLHGNMSQVDRASVFHAFQTGPEQGILLCTDVAARGLDMPHIDWIVHYDPPTDERCYVHRVGRTARIGRVGDSLLFLMPHEVGYAEYLSSFVALPIEEKKHEVLLYYLTKLDPSSNHSWMQSAATLERKLAATVREDKEGLSTVAMFAYQSYLRAYSGCPRNVRQFFNPDELHLGHIAHSFGIDEKPSDLRRALRTTVKQERTLARDTSRFRQGERMEIDTKEAYHSTLVNKSVKQSRDYHEEKKISAPAPAKALQFSEFDA